MNGGTVDDQEQRNPDEATSKDDQEQQNREVKTPSGEDTEAHGYRLRGREESDPDATDSPEDEDTEGHAARFRI
jgi:hypothetical protein